MKNSIDHKNPYSILKILLALSVIEGILANFFYFMSSSESQAAFLWGYSLQRLAIGFFSIAILALFIGVFFRSNLSEEFLQTSVNKLISALDSPARQVLILLPLAIMLSLDLCINLVYWFPFLLKLAPFITVKRSLLQQTGLVQIWAFLIPVQLWAFLIGLQFMIFCRMFAGQDNAHQKRYSQPAWLAILFGASAGTALVLSILWGLIFGGGLNVVIAGPAGKLLVISIWFLIWLAFHKYIPEWTIDNEKIFVAASIGLIGFLFSAQLAQWMDSLNTPFKNYWNWLADAFLHGRLYLINPASTGDMTLYKGNWYIPNPPLPGILLMPFIAVWGIAGFNTTLFSLVLSSITSILVFLILEELSQRKWISLSRSGILWLVVLFSFGTVELWLSISTVMWFFSQICTILFVTAAFLFVLKGYPAWLSGLALGVALTSRPNVFALWPALFFIALQMQIDLDGRFSWKRMINWAVWSALPVFISVGLLLYYNFLRFGNILDFGYVDINGSALVVKHVREYGMFNLYFVQDNFQAMFLAVPQLTAKCEYYFPRGNGLSLIFTTPAIIYIFKRFKFSWWMLGCWISILLSIGLLLTYHNNGSVQIAYRYMLDFSIPTIMVMAFTSGEHISTPLKALILLSVIISYLSNIAWYFGPC